MQQICYWGDPHYVPNPPLSEDSETDVLIIGGGVAGLFTAYHLLQKGVSDITIVEARTIGSGSTGRSAGMFSCDPETASWFEMMHAHGEAKTKLYFEAQKRAIETAREVIEEGSISCDFSIRDFIIVGNDATRFSVRNEFCTLEKIGGKSRWLEGNNFREELTTPLYSLGERRQSAVSVDPMRFIQGVGAYLLSRGVHIYEGTTVDSIVENTAHANGHVIGFNRLVQAKGPGYQGEDATNYVTTIGITDPLPGSVLEDLALTDKDMFADMQKPSFFYGKVTGEDRLMVGYGDAVTDSSVANVPLFEPHFGALAAYLKQLSPGSGLEFAYAWSGVFSLSVSPLPVVRVEGANALIAGVGSQIASIALAEYVATKLVTGEHPLDQLF